jgi:hypothetical protein
VKVLRVRCVVVVLKFVELKLCFFETEGQVVDFGLEETVLLFEVFHALLFLLPVVLGVYFVFARLFSILFRGVVVVVELALRLVEILAENGESAIGGRGLKGVEGG